MRQSHCSTSKEYSQIQLAVNKTRSGRELGTKDCSATTDRYTTLQIACHFFVMMRHRPLDSLVTQLTADLKWSRK